MPPREQPRVPSECTRRMPPWRDAPRVVLQVAGLYCTRHCHALFKEREVQEGHAASLYGHVQDARMA